MAVGVILARYAASRDHYVIAAFGVLWVAIGGLMLVWSGWHYEDLHGPLRAGQSPVHVGASRVVGVATVAFVGLALVMAVYLTVIDR